MKRHHALFAILLSVAAASCGATTTPLLANTHPGGLGLRPSSAIVRGVAGEALAIEVYPRIATEGPVSVRMRIEPDALSRSVEISWWSAEGLGGSSLMDVDGDRAAIRYEFPIRRIDPGEYEVSAILTRSDGTRIRRTTTVMVIGRGPEF